MDKSGRAFTLFGEGMKWPEDMATYLRIAFANGWLCVDATTPPLPTDTIEHEVGL
jgi:hypothetical protein